MIPIVLFCLIYSVTAFHLTDDDDELLFSHLKKLGFLSHYTKDVSIAEGNILDNLTDGTDTEYYKRDIFFHRSLIHTRLFHGETVLNYLDDFGYLDGYKGLKHTHGSDDLVVSLEDLEGALTLFQHMNSLHLTGCVNQEVLAVMNVDRCGVPDIEDEGFLASRGIHAIKDAKELKELLNSTMPDPKTSSIQEMPANEDDQVLALEKRYKISDENWGGKNKLTFYIENVSNTLDKYTYNEIVRAFEVWTNKVELYLYEVSEERIADIRIKFESKYHGDDYSFDGANGVLAHAFYPPSGEIHFDDDEEFTRLTTEGVNLRYTASHEFGHTLGLKHSMEKGSLMSPYHMGYREVISLQPDDVAGITELFQAGKGAVYTADTTGAKEYQRYLLLSFDNSVLSNPVAENTPCIEKIDAVVHHPISHTRTLYFFSKDVYYKVKKDPFGKVGVVEGYPKKTSKGWDGLEGNIDAAYVDKSLSAAFFFKADQYWKYDFIKQKMYPGFPRKTLPKVPKGLDATIMSGHTVYFFSEEEILKENSEKNSFKTIKDKKVTIEAAIPLFARGYFGAARGDTYSVYKVKTLEEVRVYRGRPLSWDFGLPMCSNNLLDSDHLHLNPKMKPFCAAYAYLAAQDPNLDIPEECYKLVGQFPAFPLEEINEVH